MSEFPADRGEPFHPWRVALVAATAALLAFLVFSLVPWLGLGGRRSLPMAIELGVLASSIALIREPGWHDQPRLRVLLLLLGALLVGPLALLVAAVPAEVIQTGRAPWLVYAQLIRDLLADRRELALAILPHGAIFLLLGAYPGWRLRADGTRRSGLRFCLIGLIVGISVGGVCCLVAVNGGEGGKKLVFCFCMAAALVSAISDSGVRVLHRHVDGPAD